MELDWTPGTTFLVLYSLNSTSAANIGSAGQESDYRLLSNNSLAVLSGDVTSGGKFECQARTELDDARLEHTVEVVQRTVFTESPRHLTAVQGEPVELSCEVSLDKRFLQDVEIMWRLNRELIISSGKAQH